MWDPRMEALDSCRVLRFGTRGNGHSETTRGVYDFELLADDVKALPGVSGAGSRRRGSDPG